MSGRILSNIERKAMAYQSQGTNPNGSLESRAYQLFDTVVFKDGETQYNLFGQTQGQSTRFLTNMKGAGSIPSGQSFLALGISYAFDPVDDTPNEALYNAFYAFMRNSLWTFARENSSFDAYFPGDKLLPAMAGIFNVAAGAPARVGDYVRSSGSYKFAVPVVLGQSASFDFKIEIPGALAANTALAEADAKVKVFLDGVLTRKK